MTIHSLNRMIQREPGSESSALHQERKVQANCLYSMIYKEPGPEKGIAPGAAKFRHRMPGPIQALQARANPGTSCHLP